MADVEERLIRKAITGTILGVIGFGIGSAAKCAADGKPLGLECVVASATESLAKDATNLGVEAWFNFSVPGQVLTQTGARKAINKEINEYKHESVIGTVPKLGCNADQEEHQGLCYNKSEIPSNYIFSSAGRYTKPCGSGERDDGISCWRDTKGRGTGFAWEFGDSPFNLESAWRRCEHRYSRGNCEQYGAIIYPKCEHLYGKNYTNEGCCLCKSKLGLSYIKDTKWVTGRVMSQHCSPGQELHDGLCYEISDEDKKEGWEYLSPGVYRRKLRPDELPPEENPVQKATDILPELLGTIGLAIGLIYG